MVKKVIYISLLLLFFIAINVKSHDTALFNEHMRWRYTVHSNAEYDNMFDGSIESLYRILYDEFFSFEGTSIIDGKEYWVLSFLRAEYDSGVTDVDSAYPFEPPYEPTTINIRVEDGCIYVREDEYLLLLSKDTYWGNCAGDIGYIPYRRTGDGELVLYDFNMSAGDKYTSVDGHRDIVVASVDTLVTRDGVERKRIQLSNGYTVIEGIGCVNSPGTFLFYLNPAYKSRLGFLRSLDLGYNGSQIDNIIFGQDLKTAMDIRPLLGYQHAAFKLFNELEETKAQTDNICFSPLSAQLALSMVLNGADGNTLKEMKSALGVSDYSDGEINLFNQALTKSITTRPEFLPEQWKWYADTEEEARKYYDAEYPVCEIANSIWHRPDITLFDSFTDTARSYYDAGIGSVRFDTQEGIDQINQWVSDKTHTLIPKIYNEPQSAELALVLANALYFKGAWHTPFDKANTRPGVFHNANGSNVMTDMMTVRAEYQSTTTDKFQTVTLPYGNGDFSMTIFLPVEGTKLPDLTRADWIQTVSQPQQFRPYALTFPRFDFGDSHELNDILKKMGMSEAFDKDKADFTRMTDCQTFISKVLQLNKISVDEAGTEAAAVTIIGMDTEGMEDPDPINYEPFRIDQPFYFTIENRKEKAVLFVGRVATLEGEPFTSKPADVNQDNTVDISDIVAVINVIAGTDSNDKADVNADGKVDISDIVAIINSIAK